MVDCRRNATLCHKKLSEGINMKPQYLFLLLTSLILTGCNKNTTGSAYYKATIVQTSDVSCYLPVLDFSEDASKIYGLTSIPATMFSVTRLPANFNMVGKKLYVSVTTPRPEEDFPCNTLGIGYPHLTLLDVKDRQ